MFTGIVQGLARVLSTSEAGGVRAFVLLLPASLCRGLKKGASLSVDGVCLTVTEPPVRGRVTCDAVHQSLAVTTLSQLMVGDQVNVERAARDGAEIGGHPLSGHVDFSAPISKVTQLGRNIILRIEIPDRFRRYLFSKGYVAAHGCSLTVAECDRAQGWIEIWLIPETQATTTLASKEAGDRLNIEIERETQVIVDTVRDAFSEMLGKLAPRLSALLQSASDAASPNRRVVLLNPASAAP